ncbi:MAG: amidohydrolase family protein [Acidaminococcaceae bacterium]|nr:amidohydrolase family protein [Acidaminococcaceae bacterium]
MTNTTMLSFSMPQGACNAHLHIIDPRFPNDGKATEQIGTIETYKAIAAKLHLDRAVFVQAKTFGCDNTCLLDAIEKFGRKNSVGIAVVTNEVTDSELKRLDDGGVKGLRFSVWNPNNAVVSFEDCLPLSRRVYDFGWNMQLHMSAKQLAERAEIIRQIPSKVVIDHMGRMDPHLGINDPALPILFSLIDKGNVWVKISGPYLNTVTGYPWEDSDELARKIAVYAPERIVWGSDFPHVTEKVKPDETYLTNMIVRWIPDEKTRKLALVTNPEELYGFGK